MAINVQLNVYAINQSTLPRDQSKRLGFPTANILFQDVSGSSQRSLSSGYNVYGLITVGGQISGITGQNTLYYVQESAAQLATLIG